MSRAEEIAKLQQRADKLACRLRYLQEREHNEVAAPELRKSVGRCFKFLNSYGGDSEKWWFYVRIISFNDRDMTYGTVQFQSTSAHHIEVEYEKQYNWQGQSRFGEGRGWVPISVAEYNRANRAVQRHLKEILETQP
jgi:hypothetical protein